MSYRKTFAATAAALVVSLIAPVLSLAPATAAPKSETGLPTVITQAVNGRWLQTDQVEKLRSADPAGYAARLKLLSSSKALMSLLNTQVGDSQAEIQVQELAAATSTDMVRSFVRNTAGKTFQATQINGEWGVKLVDSKEAKTGDVAAKGSPVVMPKCFQAWVAAFAWYIGTGAICGAVSLATFEVMFAGGVACFAGLFTAGMVINWNNAC